MRINLDLVLACWTALISCVSCERANMCLVVGSTGGDRLLVKKHVER